MTRLKKFRNAIIGVVVMICTVKVIVRQFEGSVFHKQAAAPTVEISRRQLDVKKKKNTSTQPAIKLQKSLEMKARLEHTRASCKAHGYMNKTSQKDKYLNRILVDQKNKVLFCLIPKVASTNFRRIYLATTSAVSKEEALSMSGSDVFTKYLHNFVKLRQFSDIKRKEMMQSYTKIMFVREPLEKLLSGYRNKFFHSKIDVRKIYYNQISNFYRKVSVPGKNRKLAINATTKTISFTDFLTYWTDVFKRGRNIDPHFALSSDLCMPCTVPYDFIGKFDSLYDDVEFIFNKLKMDVQFPKRTGNVSSKATVDILKDNYKEVSRPLLRNVCKYLSADFELFGYPVPDWIP